MALEERKHISALTIKVLANLVYDGVNEVKKIIKTYENAVELKLNREKVAIDSTKTQTPTAIKMGAAGSSGGSIIDSQKIIQTRDFIFRVPEYTSDGITTLQHNLSNSYPTVDIWEYENGEIVADIRSATIRMFPDYIEIEELEYGAQYLVLITG
jgi:hypothetical protein